MSAAPAPHADLGAGVTCIDTLQERPGLAACYLLSRAGEHALVDTGTAPGVPRLLALLAARGIAREAVRWVIPTHAHLDHAGGAGALMAALPSATLVAHPRAGRHLVDPARLIAGATAVYGAEAMGRMYGAIEPVAAGRVRTMADGERLPLGAGTLEFLDTPGHARHHFCIVDPPSDGIFCGDTFGLSYRDFDGPRGPLVLPTTTPVQFEPDAWRATLDRLLGRSPGRVFLTHYGELREVPRHAATLRAALGRYEAIARGLAGAPDRHARLVAALTGDALDALRALGMPVPEARARALLAADMALNAQGLAVWLDAGDAPA